MEFLTHKLIRLLSISVLILILNDIDVQQDVQPLNVGQQGVENENKWSVV